MSRHEHDRHDQDRHEHDRNEDDAVELDITPDDARAADPGQDRPDRSERQLGRGSAWTSGAIRLGARARAAGDRPLLTALFVTVVIAAAVALAGPRLLGHALDAGLAGAVADAGADGQLRLVVRMDLDKVTAGLGGTNLPAPSYTGADLAAAAKVYGDGLPPDLARLRGPVLIDALTNPTKSARPAASGVPLSIRLGYVAGPGTGVEFVRGDAPTDAAVHPKPPGTVVPVAVSESVARAAGLEPGSRLRLDPERAPLMTVEVTGVFRAKDPGAPAWRNLPTVLEPRRVTGNRPRVDATLLLDDSALPLVDEGLRGTSNFTGNIRQTLDTAALRTDDLPRLRAGLARLNAATPELPVLATPHVGLASVLDRFDSQAVAVRAQLSLLLVGVVGVAVLLSLLAAQALIARRRDDLALEHARGAPLLIVAARLATESVPIAVAGCAVAAVLVAGSSALLGGWSQLSPAAGLSGPGDALPFLVVLVVAASALPLLGAWTARAAWSGGGRNRVRLASRRVRAQGRSRRLVIEAFLLVVAVGAVASLRGRGLSAASAGLGGDVDPYLAAAPTLLALVAAVLAVRVQPWPLRALTALARRGRGMVALVATARAGHGLRGTPLLALTLAVGIAIATGLIRDTVVHGQEVASWERVGADVRATGSFTGADAEKLRAEPGVTGVALGNQFGALRVRIANRSQQVQVIGVDAADYAGVLDHTPTDRVASIRALAAGGDTPPVAVDADLLARMQGVDVSLFVNSQYVTVQPVAVAPEATAGWVPGDVLFIDSGAVERLTGRAVPATVLWASGPGAARAVTSLTEGRPGTVLTRSGWLASMRSTALVEQVLWLAWLAAVMTGILAAAAVVSSVLVGARQRGRALAVLRTLGLQLRPGRLLAVAELAPMLVIGTLAGAVAGLAIVLLLGPALGLELLAGGLGAPPLRGDPWFVAGVAAGVLVVFGLATTAELSAHRRDRLSDVMRTSR